MRAVVWFLLLFVVAVVAASTLGTNDGLVSIYAGAWRLDTSLNLFLLLLVGTCFLLVSLIQGVGLLTGLPRRAREWRVRRRDRSAQAALRDALAQFFGGRYSRAQTSAQRALDIQTATEQDGRDDEFTVLCLLLAAGGAHRLQDRTRRDEYLQRALALTGKGSGSGTGIGRPAEEGARLLAAEWALDDRDASRALGLLAQLPPGVARRTHALRLKLQAARLGQQPQEALHTARLLAKHQGFSRAAATGLLRSLAIESLQTARDLDQLRRVWLQFDAADRRDAVVASRAAMLAAGMGGADEGRAWLRPFWDRLADLADDERAVLAEAMGPVAAGMGADWLPRLEAAAQAFPRDAAIAYAVGSALVERQLWGRARVLLEQAAGAPAFAPALRRRAWGLLARIAAEQGDVARVHQCHEQAAQIP